MESAIRDHPNISVLQLKNTILRKCKIDVSRQKVQRAKREALEKIRGSDSVQYEKLWDYCETVRKFNPGSKLILKKLEGSNSPIFDKMYVCLSALKNGFLSGCRPIIGLDGCFLKTCYGGQLLVAVGRDGNDNMFPIAMAVVQVENRKNWTWFLGELLDDIGGLGTSMWSFISDRQKGLIEALKDLVPDSEHRFCLRHMYENFKMKFKSQELKEFFWKAASTANKSDFERYMQKINELDPKKKVDVETASEWLRKINLEHWARAFFPLQSKCDILVNNICESFNNYILDARDKPIITMLEWIRTKLMTRLQQKREGMEKALVMRKYLWKVLKFLQQARSMNCSLKQQKEPRSKKQEEQVQPHCQQALLHLLRRRPCRTARSSPPELGDGDVAQNSLTSPPVTSSPCKGGNLASPPSAAPFRRGAAKSRHCRPGSGRGAQIQGDVASTPGAVAGL
ncbi:hypothetical protein Sango_1554200 [Sesamum angolense]|uniref:MULE transposase domain-containing protein n=1 Tax=Sesamum angolense TaxID=2727404 RepID=A0AAE2BTG8_9LAMI|nr:hypothetical protein Sango_1554200 [Sesamum angolense]